MMHLTDKKHLTSYKRSSIKINTTDIVLLT